MVHSDEKVEGDGGRRRSQQFAHLAHQSGLVESPLVGRKLLVCPDLSMTVPEHPPHFNFERLLFLSEWWIVKELASPAGLVGTAASRGADWRPLLQQRAWLTCSLASI